MNKTTTTMKLFKRSMSIMSDRSDSENDNKSEKSLLNNQNKIESISRRRRVATSDNSDSDDD